MSIGPASEQWQWCSDEGLIYLKSTQLNLIIINYPGTYVICYELVSRSGAQLILLKSNFSIIETGISAWAVKGLLAGKLVFSMSIMCMIKFINMASTYLVLFWEYFTTLATDLCNSSGNMVRSPSALTQTPCFMIISLKTQKWI